MPIAEAVHLILMILLFAIVVWGLQYACTAFHMPTPVFWICGALVIIIALYWLSNEVGLLGTTTHSK